MHFEAKPFNTIITWFKCTQVACIYIYKLFNFNSHVFIPPKKCNLTTHPVTAVIRIQLQYINIRESRAHFCSDCILYIIFNKLSARPSALNPHLVDRSQVHLTARDAARVPHRFMFAARRVLLELAENLLHRAGRMMDE